MVETFPTSITLQWHSWQGIVEEGYEITYLIEYMHYSSESYQLTDAPKWQRGEGRKGVGGKGMEKERRRGVLLYYQ